MFTTGLLRFMAGRLVSMQQVLGVRFVAGRLVGMQQVLGVRFVSEGGWAGRQVGRVVCISKWT